MCCSVHTENKSFFFFLFHFQEDIKFPSSGLPALGQHSAIFCLCHLQSAASQVLVPRQEVRAGGCPSLWAGAAGWAHACVPGAAWRWVAVPRRTARRGGGLLSRSALLSRSCAFLGKRNGSLRTALKMGNTYKI